MRSLLDSGSIAKDDSGALDLSGAAGLSSNALPETIQQAVAARIERLPDEPRDVLSIASVLGKSFEFRDLETLAEGASGLDESVERLVRDGLLEEEPGSRGDRLAFASGIVRDVLYNTVARRKRKLLHRKYAELLEKRQAGRLERVYPDLLHHFSEADVPEKAVEYGLKLAQKSLLAFSPEEAARVARSVLDYVEGAAWSGESSRRARLLAQASQMGGNVDGALRGEAAVKAFEGEPSAPWPPKCSPRRRLESRRVDEARRWAEGPAGGARTRPGGPRSRSSPRGDRLDDAESTRPRRRTSRCRRPRRGRPSRRKRPGAAAVALANPSRPRAGRTNRGRRSPVDRLETLVTTDPQETSCRAPLWTVSGTHRVARPRAGSSSDGSPVTASAVNVFRGR